MHVAQIVGDLAIAQPLGKRGEKIVVGEVLAPNSSRTSLPALTRRTIQVEQAPPGLAIDPTSWLPVGTGPWWLRRPGSTWSRILPRSRSERHSGLRMNLHEYIHPHALRRDEAVLLRLVIFMGAHQLDTLAGEGRG